jgi:hypothetical protein
MQLRVRRVSQTSESTGEIRPCKSLTNSTQLEQNLAVTTASNPLEWVNRPRHMGMTPPTLSRRRARRISRSFAGVGVAIAPVRLQQIAAGAACPNDELTDVKFALAATQIVRDERRARFERGRRRGIQCLIFAGLVLAALNLLICMALVMLTALEHSSAF